LYTGLRFEYREIRLSLWASTSASHAISAVAELLVTGGVTNIGLCTLSTRGLIM